MKIKFLLPSLAASACLAAVALLIAACETESAGGSSLSVSPSSATLGLDQSITLKASGGETYSWSLANTEIGHLSGNSGGVVIYTATSVGTNQTVTVSTGGGSSSMSGTNTVVSTGTSASVSIKQQ